MAVTPEDVRRVATLARLRLDEGDVEAMTRQLNSILEHVDELEKVQLPGDMGDAPDGRAPLRPDDPAADPLARPPEDLAPGWQEGFFTVPRLASHDQDEAGGAESMEDRS